MKWFTRRPKTPSILDELRAALDANPGQWQPFPDSMAMGRKAFLLYDVVGEPDGTVWIRKKPNA